ncbi:uncharacterized protein LOC130451036 [Diorhabda sublineata]|uniref:uncharacterized protein LOC130451035 n=1 Tax=Diorhabda sublineata TaxID=1163346 RepID=UPI0024E15418|nr:uncharacterized protein LOC130451035 [Diorhabda sublineata]XP_056645811.1 uncharacterized protein LOC130451036 [Diorhabda sublineata]
MKAEERTSALQKILPNIGGPASQRRRVLLEIIHSILLYGAPIWAEVMQIKKYRSKYTSTRRKPLLRVCTAYRTVSAIALKTIAGAIPIHILVDERVRIYKRVQTDRGRNTINKIKNEERKISLDKWQREWQEGAKAE